MPKNLWPKSYKELAAIPPQGYEISTRVMAPLLILSRKDNSYYATLGVKKTFRGQERIVVSEGVEYDWVEDGNIIYPLPHDVYTTASRALEGMQAHALTFPDILRLEREATDSLPVLRNIELLSANLEAEKEEASGTIMGLNASLYPYQYRGVMWMNKMLSHTGGVILADEMGLGKTIQIISLFLLHSPSPLSPALIICPTTLIENWVRELKRFSPSFTILVHRGSDRAGLHKDLQRTDIIITTYDTLVNDLVLFKAVKWHFLICDEAQAIKNPDSKRRVAVSQLKSVYKIPVTGTPVENSLLDLWSLIDVAVPGLLGTRHEFEKHWCDNIESAQSLGAVTDPFVLKRQVCEVAKDLPERIDIDIPLELGANLAQLYEQLRQDTLDKYPKAGALVATGQLQLFCAHPWLNAKSYAEGWEDKVDVLSNGVPLATPKVEYTMQLLREAFLRKRKVLIFANFNECGPIIKQAAETLPPSFWGSINGSTPPKDRQNIVDEFSAYDGPGVLILNPRAAGAGLNITAATVVVHYTQVWNPALEKQASARAYRRGQTQPVTIYRLFYVQTVEEIMLDRTLWKSELGNEAVPVTTRDAEDVARALAISPVGER